MYRNNLVGQTFGRLTVVAESGRTKDRHIQYECVCECGNHKIVSGKDILSGHTRSCGCRERIKHGGCKADNRDRLYGIWSSMRSRCNRKSSKSYSDYGGRGIRVCDEWNDYSAFRTWAYENGYDKDAPQWKCTLDRIDTNGNYEPNNCRWVSESVQMFNRRRKKSKTGIRGVYYRERDKKYYAMISKDYKQIYLGKYDRVEDAVAVRHEAEVRYYGTTLDT